MIIKVVQTQINIISNTLCAVYGGEAMWGFFVR